LNIPGKVSAIAFIMLSASLGLAAPAQVARDAAEIRFDDDLLDHFVGSWTVDIVAYGQKFTANREVEWVLNHQFLRFHEKTREAVPWLKVPMERIIYIGYNHRTHRYVVHEMNVHGADIPSEPEGFSYAYRKGDALIFEHKNGSELVATGRWTWDAASGTWLNQASRVIAGKEQVPHVVQTATAAKPMEK
jgi:hypothetical protein